MSMDYDFVTKYYKEDVHLMCLDYRQELKEMYRWANEYNDKHGVCVLESDEFKKIVQNLEFEIEEESYFE